MISCLRNFAKMNNIEAKEGILWRFDSKKKLLEWARREREQKWISKISFTEGEEIRSESEYYKEQNIMYKLNVIMENNNDVIKKA